MTGKVKNQILRVRDDGRTNMFDVNGVMYVANDLNLFELVVYLMDKDNRKEYSRFIMTGEAEIEEDPENEDADKHAALPATRPINEPPVDMNDPEAAKTAVELQFPETFSPKALACVRDFEGSMYLYRYKGKFVLTDESLYLTDHGDGSHEAPYGGPRYICDTMEEVESWLEQVYDDNYADKLLTLTRYINIEPTDNWYTGTIGGYPFQVKVTEEGSEWGIDNGRIIKLFITTESGDEIVSYERGWDKYPENNLDYIALIDALCEYFANRMDKEDQHDSREHDSEADV